jgi:alginate O-acetyltransferase complex protein AlgI
MLFNTFSFILIFLPMMLVGFFLLARVSQSGASLFLALGSLSFYGFWDIQYIPLLLASIAFNFLTGKAIAWSVQSTKQSQASILLTTGLIANLVVLAYFKYFNFFISQANTLLGSPIEIANIILPLGISFFTFTQIAFLVDVRRGGVVEPNPIHYLLFVTYFPHLIAGPVLHHKEMMPQFRNSATYKFNWENMAVGSSIFAIGLAKKVLLADGVAGYVGPVFDAASNGQSIDFFEAWGGALAYTFQLYFDFSGYSDMAIGLSRMFGVVLPLNFNSPYKARSIADFWRRWHMTLSRFLRDYLYIPLGGNRNRRARRYLNLFLTMTLGGLWHGAGWTFVIWGILHGVFLIINNIWSSLTKDFFLLSLRARNVMGWLSLGMTFISVVIAWVFFRASSIDAALQIIGGMIGLNGVPLPGRGLVGVEVAGVLEGLGIHFGWPGSLFGGFEHACWLFGLLVVVWFFPNTQEIMWKFRPGLESVVMDRKKPLYLFWRPTLVTCLLACLAFMASFVQLNRVSEFLYFQF